MRDDAWRALIDWPDRAFDAGDLALVGRSAREAEAALKKGLKAVPLHPWPWHADGLATHFGTAGAASCLAVPPHAWTSFHEPQITGGFAHFLMEGSLRRQQQRCLAFVRAGMICQGLQPPPADLQAFTAEAVAEESRIDLLVQLDGPFGRFGATIEAKFGHDLTDQLKGAEDHLLNVRKWHKSRSALLVVARDPVPLDHRYFVGSWHSASWWTFLRQLDAEMQAEADCTDYARFRRTVWLQAYGG